MAGGIVFRRIGRRIVPIKASTASGIKKAGEKHSRRVDRVSKRAKRVDRQAGTLSALSKSGTFG